jgi:hypothetical protein
MASRVANKRAIITEKGGIGKFTSRLPRGRGKGYTNINISARFKKDHNRTI